MHNLDIETVNSSSKNDRLDETERFQRVKISVLGRYMLANRSEYPCQIIEMSPGDATFIAPAAGEFGEKIIAYLDDVGRIEGKISQIIEGGFIVSFSASERKRDKLAAQLTWLANKDILGLPEERDNERIVPDFRHSALELEDGRKYPCKIIDISISGAAIEINVRPEIGTNIVLGRMQAKIVRHIENGVGVQFVTAQEMINVVQQNLRLA